MAGVERFHPQPLFSPDSTPGSSPVNPEANKDYIIVNATTEQEMQVQIQQAAKEMSSYLQAPYLEQPITQFLQAGLRIEGLRGIGLGISEDKVVGPTMVPFAMMVDTTVEDREIAALTALQDAYSDILDDAILEGDVPI